MAGQAERPREQAFVPSSLAPIQQHFSRPQATSKSKPAALPEHPQLVHRQIGVFSVLRVVRPIKTGASSYYIDSKHEIRLTLIGNGRP
jgi:hypothetical protein